MFCKLRLSIQSVVNSLKKILCYSHNGGYLKWRKNCRPPVLTELSIDTAFDPPYLFNRHYLYCFYLQPWFKVYHPCPVINRLIFVYFLQWLSVINFIIVLQFSNHHDPKPAFWARILTLMQSFYIFSLFAVRYSMALHHVFRLALWDCNRKGTIRFPNLVCKITFP